jgi:hypothetical protein
MGTYGADGANGATGYSTKVAGFVLGKAKARGAEEGFLTQRSEEHPGVVKLRKAQDSVLHAEGFEPAGGDLWRREGIYFGREAALQNAHSSLLQHAVRAAYDRAAYDEPGESPQGKAV